MFILFVFFNETASTEIYTYLHTLSLHDALPIVRTSLKIAEGNGQFGAISRLALLTAQRREKIAALRWAEVTNDGIWNIPTEEREKGNGGALQLPVAALDRKSTRLNSSH